MIFYLFSVRREADIFPGLVVVLSSDDSRERDTLIGWTIEDVCIERSICFREIFSQSVDVYLREFRESLCVWHEIASSEKPGKESS